jgi:hypothetical protein
MASLQSSLKKLTGKYLDQFEQLEACFLEENNLITLAAHYVMLASFLEALFNEVLIWLVDVYERPNECLDFTSKIKPFINWEYGHHSSDDGNWKSHFIESFKPSSKETKKILHRLPLILEDLQFIDLLESIFTDLINKRNNVAHGSIYRSSIMNKRLKTEYNLQDLKEQSKRVEKIMDDLFKSCNRLLDPKVITEADLQLHKYKRRVGDK